MIKHFKALTWNAVHWNTNHGRTLTTELGSNQELELESVSDAGELWHVASCHVRLVEWTQTLCLRT